MLIIKCIDSYFSWVYSVKTLNMNQTHTEDQLLNRQE